MLITYASSGLKGACFLAIYCCTGYALGPDETGAQTMSRDMYLLNAFSLSMLDNVPCVVNVREASTDDIRQALEVGLKSAVGHADTAAIFSAALGVPVEVRRVNISLRPGQWAVVGQYVGPRLPEGTTRLPEGARIRWLVVEVWRHYNPEAGE